MNVANAAMLIKCRVLNKGRWCWSYCFLSSFDPGLEGSTTVFCTLLLLCLHCCFR